MRRHGRRRGVPFGPFLAARRRSSACSPATQIVDWYLDTFA